MGGLIKEGGAAGSRGLNPGDCFSEKGLSVENFE